jgi:peptidoglycan/LPS O-acetylase OafA/YrhL
LYILPQGHWIEKQFLSSYSLYDVISYLTLTFNITGPAGLFNNAYWSLPVEFQYYIIFPVIVVSIKYFGLFGPVFIGFALFVFPKLGLVEIDKDTVFRLAYSFCGGMFVGHIYKNSTIRINKIFGLTLLGALFVLVVSVRHSYLSLPDVPIISGKWNWYVWIAIATVYIILFTKVHIHNKCESFLKHYGTISYSTYLYHNIFIGVAVLILIHFNVNNGTLKLLFTFLFALFASYIAANLSYKHIEKPSIAFGRNILKSKRGIKR